MIGTILMFRYSQNFHELAVSRIAENGRARFEGMPGLRSKAFTLSPRKREAVNFYVWESEEAAKAFFSVDAIEHLARLYGVRPDVEFVEIATLVDNGRRDGEVAGRLEGAL